MPGITILPAQKGNKPYTLDSYSHVSKYLLFMPGESISVYPWDMPSSIKTSRQAEAIIRNNISDEMLFNPLSDMVLPRKLSPGKWLALIVNRELWEHWVSLRDEKFPSVRYFAPDWMLLPVCSGASSGTILDERHMVRQGQYSGFCLSFYLPKQEPYLCFALTSDLEVYPVNRKVQAEGIHPFRVSRLHPFFSGIQASWGMKTIWFFVGALLIQSGMMVMSGHSQPHVLNDDFSAAWSKITKLASKEPTGLISLTMDKKMLTFTLTGYGDCASFDKNIRAEIHSSEIIIQDSNMNGQCLTRINIPRTMVYDN